MTDRHFYYTNTFGKSVLYTLLSTQEYNVVSNFFKSLKFKCYNTATHYNGKTYSSTLSLVSDFLEIDMYYANDREFNVNFKVDGEIVSRVISHQKCKAFELLSLNKVNLSKFSDRVKSIDRSNKLYKLGL